MPEDTVPGRPGAAPLIARLRGHLAASGLLQPEDAVLVALSGGRDSVVLLHLLRFAVPELGLRVRAAHFDHAMRPGSGADADWVRGVCRAWCVPLTLERAQRRPGGEGEARALRYAFLRRAAEATGATRLATAHHADDQAETVLFRAIRGAGPRGLAGIPPRRGDLVRPLLPFTRAELAGYAAQRGIRWREDPTNRGPHAARNRLRNEVLPLLEEIAPGAARSLARIGTLARHDEAGWMALVDELLRGVVVARDEGGVELDRAQLAAYHPGVQSRLLRAVLARLGARPGEAATRAALALVQKGRSGAWVEVGGALRVGCEFDRIVVRRTGGRNAGGDASRAADAAAGRLPAGAGAGLRIEGAHGGSGQLSLAGRRWRIEWELGRAGGEAAEEGADEGTGGPAARFDSAALSFPLLVRTWLPGDRIRLAGGSRKLKKVFGERRVPASRRAALPVLVDREGRALWVPGVERSCLAPARAGEPALIIRVFNAD